MDLSTLLQIALGGLLTLAGGYLAARASLNAAKVQAEAAAKLDSAKRQDDRILKREDAQRENLLELQVALNAWARALTRIRHADIMRFKQHSKLFLSGEEMSDAEFETGRRLIFLTERVLDDDLREALTRLRAMATSQELNALAARDELTLEMLQHADIEFAFALDEVQKQLGTVLRRHLRGRE